jgi:hypothetical protein
MSMQDDGWKPIAGNLEKWNEILLRTDAHLHQYPYWNEPLRQIHLTPDYLVYTERDEPLAYLCVLRLGVPRMRIGIVRGGPVALNGPIPAAALEGLAQWAKRAGYVFIRFSHSDEGFLTQLGAYGLSDRTDAVPFYPPLEHELIVEQLPGEEETAARFQSVARRNIRDARKLDYIVKRNDTTAALEEALPVFAALHARKGQVYSRPLSSYVELVRLAMPYSGARIYTAVLDGKPIQVLLIVRDRDTAHYVIGAMDVEALADNASPGCLLHWHAMRDFYKEGARFYNLGLWGSGGLQVFKSKFRPVERIYPPPLTLVLRPSAYRLWSQMLPLLQSSRPRIEKFIGAVREWRERMGAAVSLKPTTRPSV